MGGSNEQYCVYLTTYRGSKLPPFYIGSTTVANVQRGYRGTPKSKKFKSTWKQEVKNNPHLFKTQIVCVLSTEVAAREKERKLQWLLQVVKSDLYISLVYANLKFGASGENHYLYKQVLPQSTRDKISFSKTGKKIAPDVLAARIGRFVGEKNPSFGKPKSAESKLKNAQSHLGKTHSSETKKAMSLDRKTWFWWNNGVQNKRMAKCPGENWVRGKLKRK